VFEGKTVIVTGGAGGIGSAIARRFAEEGAKIALLDLDPSAAQARAEELKREGAEALGLGVDITDAEACQRAAGAIMERWGGIDVLVNCAGLTQVGPFAENDLSVYRRVMDVNFFGSVNCTKAAMDSLRARQGRIVVISSVAGFAPLLGRTGYCAAKHALHGFFDTLRCELHRDGVSVTIVCPSFVQTGFANSGLGKDGRPLGFERSTTGKPMSPGDVAEAVFQATAKRKRLAVLSPTGKVAWWMSRLLPAFYERGMTRRFEVELERNAPDPSTGSPSSQQD
jgi:NAD(P)-dependent dehydrogenase (short-subunit alcohol dehydrogenase family)